MSSTLRTIESDRDLEEGVAALIEAEPRFRRVHSITGPPPLRRRGGGFETLIRIITDQQISLHAGAAIWSRFVELLGTVSPESVLAKAEGELRGAGQSGAKARTIHAVAKAIVEGTLDLDGLERLEDDAAAGELMRVKGIGPWTAEIYLLSCMGRRDVWPSGDVALQTGAQLAFGLEKRPSARELVEIAEPWRPWRAVAARLLWAYYRHERMGGGSVR